MNWDPWFITQDSKARTMSPVFLSTVQDTSWDPWPHRVRKRNAPWFQWTVLYNVIGGKSSGKTLSLNNTCQSLRSHGVRGHRGHTYSGIINTAHSELVVNTLFQTGHLGIKSGKKNPELMKGGDFFFSNKFSISVFIIVSIWLTSEAVSDPCLKKASPFSLNLKISRWFYQITSYYVNRITNCCCIKRVVKVFTV